ncbi:glycoside hydrolase family 16 protein [Maribacter sp. 2-571]|uniref:glycoside hydrolase family 16 protein n=1 Tax=Maribacter sp. 2-571 TaxID=3417569 RepID=UPI003D35871C
MKKKNFIIFIVPLMLVFASCNKSDDSENEKEKIQIVDNSVESADVNAIDYWDNTEIVWRDEFDGSELSKENWLTEEFFDGVFNTELQSYTSDNVEVGGGTMKINVKKIGEGQKAGDYTSARLNSKFAFKYGRLEIRAKMPSQNGNGLWVKLWMLGNNINTIGYPDCGEITFMKYLSHVPEEYSSTANTAENYRGQGSASTSPPVTLESAEENFHVYGVLWTHEYLKFYLDSIDNVTFTFNRPENPDRDNWPFSEPFYYGMDIAVGGEFGGAEGVDDTIFPTFMEVDYVRVYHAK